MLVEMGFRSHDVDNEPKVSFLISHSVAHSKTFILDLSCGFCPDKLFCTLSANLEQKVSFSSTKDFEKWSQSSSATVHSSRAGVGIICRMLFIDFHRLVRIGLSELSVIRLSKYLNASQHASSLPYNISPLCPLMPPRCPLTPSHYPLTPSHRLLKIVCRSI